MKSKGKQVGKWEGGGDIFCIYFRVLLNGMCKFSVSKIKIMYLMLYIRGQDTLCGF